MVETGRWVPGFASLDERYWEALLKDADGGSGAQMVQPTAKEASVSSGHVGPTAPNLEAQRDWWEQARILMARGEVLQLSAVGCNRGGVLVGWNGLRGFVPASHLLSLSPFTGEEQRQEELKRLVGTRLCLKILELDAEQGRFVLSERAARVDQNYRQDLLDQIGPGEIYQGTVTKLCSFGAFVDLGGLEGLVHISELSWGRVDHPGDVLEPGQSVEVYVLNIDRARGRVGLSIKRLQPDPWQSVGERYQAGQVVEGTVTHIADFGAFVRVEDGLEGLVHVSELPEAGLFHPRDAVSEGEHVTVRVLNVDSQQRRMALSLR